MPAEIQMTSRAGPVSGKTARNENFPVASWLIAPRHRAPILAFYRFARTADDVADAPTLTSSQKLTRLAGLEAALTGDGPSDPAAEPLRLVLAERGLSDRHARDLIAAFKQDAARTRYRDWADLMAYCALSAAPVGRFVLDVHGEPQTLWPASDALCAALQVINHLQDCAPDYHRLDRVYLPSAIMEKYGASLADLDGASASPAFRLLFADLLARCTSLMKKSALLAPAVRSRRLALEIDVIEALARDQIRHLLHNDPLADEPRPTRPAMLATAAKAVWGGLLRGAGKAPSLEPGEERSDDG